MESGHNSDISRLLQEVDERRLERESHVSYSQVAGEYYDGMHLTCRAFDFLDHRILQAHRQKYGLIEGGKRYLEVGCGSVALLRHLLPTNSSLIVGDICAETTQHSLPLPSNMSYGHFSALNLPFAEESFDGVFAFLADPYNVPRFYEEARRVLVTGGFLLVTSPTRLWAKTLRDGNGESLHYALFTMLEGKTVSIPSVTWSREEYYRILGYAGFTVRFYEEFCLPSDYPCERIPDTIRIPAERLGTEVARLPLVATLLSQK